MYIAAGEVNAGFMCINPKGLGPILNFKHVGNPIGFSKTARALNKVRYMLTHFADSGP